MATAGFDVVVGNPPYVSNWELTETDETLPERIEKLYPDITYGHWDLFIPFTHQGLCLTRPSGYQSFITPNSLATEKYGKKLRESLIKDFNLKKLVQFHDHSVFNDVDRQYLISVVNISKRSSELCGLYEYKSGDFMKTSEIEPEMFLDYSNSTFRIDISHKEHQIKSCIESQSLRLGHLCVVNPGVVAHAASDSPLDFKKADVISSQHCENKERYLSGGDIHRYRAEWQGKYMDYDSKQEHFHRPKYPELFDSPKIMFSGISGKNARIRSCYDEEQYYTNHNVLHAALLTGEIRRHHSSQDYSITDHVENFNLKYIAALVNSKLSNYYFKRFLATGTLQGSYSSMYPEDVRKLPIYEPDFNQESMDPDDIVALKDSEHMDGCKTTQEVLAKLTGEMVKYNKYHAGLNLNLLDYVSGELEGIKLTSIGLTQPAERMGNSVLRETSNQKPNLRIGFCETLRKSTNTVEICLTARYKPDDKDAFETDQWGYTETDLLPAFRITDLTETEANLIEHFIPVVVDEAGGFANFRETATKTNSLIDRLKAIELPDADDVADDLENYLETKKRAAELETKIEKTDQLIDEIVYELYGLTDEEIDIVEDAIAD